MGKRSRRNRRANGTTTTKHRPKTFDSRLVVRPIADTLIALGDGRKANLDGPVASLMEAAAAHGQGPVGATAFMSLYAAIESLQQRWLLDGRQPDARASVDRACINAGLLAGEDWPELPGLAAIAQTGDPDAFLRISDEEYDLDIRYAIARLAGRVAADAARPGDTTALSVDRLLWGGHRVETLLPGTPSPPIPGKPKPAPLVPSTFGCSFGNADDAHLDALLAQSGWLLPEAHLDPAEDAVVDLAEPWKAASWNRGRPDRTPREPVDVGAVVLLSNWTCFQFARLARRGRDGLLADGPPTLVRIARQQVTAAVRVATAAPYLLDAATAVDVLSSEPPEESAFRENWHLPFPGCLVVFDQPLEVPSDLLAWPEEMTRGLDERRFERTAMLTAMLADPGPHAENDESAEDWFEVPTALEAARDSGAWLEGLVLSETADGLGDAVVWLISTPSGEMNDAGTDKRQFATVVGLRSASTLDPLVRNLAALLCWGPWGEPVPVESPRQRKERLRGQGTADRASRPSVRVLDVKAIYTTPPESETAEQTGARRAEHRRRGHWHRFRVGPRSDWRYIRRWIPALVVNPGVGVSDGRPRVYRLPRPQAGE